MKRIIFGLIIYFCYLTVSAQLLTVRYVNATGDIVEMPTNRITSDFGHRFSTWSNGSWSPSPWHKGIDYAPC
ncbi:MAG: hypothetical protein CVU06_16770, partial [Bacteroidetes bacterium HGW-Bacteroidetes-22]